MQPAKMGTPVNKFTTVTSTGPQNKMFFKE
jgi:hypothetical protein